MDEAQTNPVTIDAKSSAQRGWSGKELLRLLAALVFVVGSILLLRATPWGKNVVFSNVDRLREWVESYGKWSWLMFLLVGTALVSFGFPRVVLAAGAGAVFNLFTGIILAQIATTIASIVGFVYTRWIARDLAAKRIGGRLLRLDNLINRHGFMTVLLIRLCPVGNAFLTNCLAGVSSVKFWDYLAASFLGFLPETIAFALLGAGVADPYSLRLWIGGSVFLLLTFFFIAYLRSSAFGSQILQALRED